VIREQCEQRGDGSIARSTHRTGVAGRLIRIVNCSTMHRTGNAVRGSHRAGRGYGFRVTAGLLLRGRRRQRSGARVERYEGRKRRRLKDDPGGCPEPQVPSERGHVTPPSLSELRRSTQTRPARRPRGLRPRDRGSVCGLRQRVCGPSTDQCRLRTSPVRDNSENRSQFSSHLRKQI
jgi:hypothetical protein